VKPIDHAFSLRDIVKGQSNKVIAFSLNIVEQTVKNHIKSILSKLNANDRTGAAMIAMRGGCIDLYENSYYYRPQDGNRSPLVHQRAQFLHYHAA
jgi:hypothetical protein